jgi:ABC-type sugar transport system ATPase subunit
MISVEGLTIRQGQLALSQVTLHIPEGSYAVLMGPSGCGKTTVIEAICGLRPIKAGKIIVGGVDVTQAPPGGRGIGYVPQDGALFATMSVRRHLSFALRIRGWKQNKIQERVEELARQLKIEALLDRLPHGLSGGEIQRVAIGRALSFSPKVLVLDEPLSSMDEDARDAFVALLLEIHRANRITVLHITHHRREARQLGTIHFHFQNNSIVAAASSDLESYEVFQSRTSPRSEQAFNPETNRRL